MDLNDLLWMKYTIQISAQASKTNLRVGAVLVSEHNELICSAYSGEVDAVSWCTILLKKVVDLKVTNARGIYLTINTLSESSLDLLQLLKAVHLTEIYIGVPDPSLSLYLPDDPVTSLDGVFRYPDELQREILEQNKSFFDNSKQSIKNSLFYFENRISALVLEKLKLSGIDITKEELSANKKVNTLTALICKKYGHEYSEMFDFVHEVISEAFDEKYSRYSYLYDTRSLDTNWERTFLDIYQKVSVVPLSDTKIINIGVGGGNEAEVLFSECRYITFVDIASSGLERVKEQIPESRVIVASADDLSVLPDKSYNMYISLRTYNSSFFDIKKAIKEARRVLMQGASIIISVANGFLCSERMCIIPGLIIPETEFVDIYRSLNMVRVIRAELEEYDFKKIQIFPTNTEIYIVAVLG